MSHDECSLDLNPFGRFCGFLVDRAGAGGVVGPVATRLIWGLVLLIGLLLAGRIARRVVTHAMERSATDVQVRTLVNNVLAATTIAVAVLAALTQAGVPLSALLTFGGVGILAIGLAFQDLLRNVLAGIILLVERPFRLGDLVTIGDLTGRVQTIQLRTTALRLGDGRLAVIPNLSAFNGSVINASAYDVRQFGVSAWVDEDADIGEAMRTARTVLEETPAIEKEPSPKVVPQLDADHHVTLLCQYWLRQESTDPDAVAADVLRRLQAGLRRR